ncbi:MAG: peptidylprolyl isomerase [Pseudomonadota bacterium]
MGAGSDAIAQKKKGKGKTTVNPVVIIKTSMGTIKAEIFVDRTPVSAKNFLDYVKDKFYDGTIFHRVMPGFVIQGGGFDASMKQKATRPPITNEAKLGPKNTAGTLSMARTSDPNSATSQFFISLRDNASLDYRNDSPQGIGYAVFGKVIEGMDVVNKIKDVPTGVFGQHSDVPNTPVVIESVRLATSV